MQQMCFWLKNRWLVHGMQIWHPQGMMFHILIYPSEVLFAHNFTPNVHENWCNIHILLQHIPAQLRVHKFHIRNVCSWYECLFYKYNGSVVSYMTLHVIQRDLWLKTNMIEHGLQVLSNSFSGFLDNYFITVTGIFDLLTT